MACDCHAHARSIAVHVTEDAVQCKHDFRQHHQRAWKFDPLHCHFFEQPHGVGEISFPTVAKTKRTDVQLVNHEILHAARHCQPGREFIRRLPQLPEWRQSIALLYMRESCFVGQNGNEGGVADYSL